jgi:uncharacterized protein (DUF1499 family)
MNKLTKIICISLILLTGCTSIPPDLGVNNGQLTPCPEKPNCVSSLATDKSQYVEPILYTGTSLQIKSDILKVLSELPNTKITVTEASYIRVEFTSSVFSFVDDVEFYFPDTESASTNIQVRSASRVGYSDFGANRKRIEQIRTQFKVLNTEK